MLTRRTERCYSARGEKWVVRVTYAIERSNATTVAAGPLGPRRPMPRPADILVTALPLSVRWLGQDGLGTNRGDIHCRVDGLGIKQGIDAAALSDKAGGCWIYRRDASVKIHGAADSDGVPHQRLAIRRDAAGSGGDLYFAPYRNERDTPMTLRLLLGDGTTAVARFTGQPCDPHQRGALPADSAAVARPGDDLSELVHRCGTLRLAGGRYELTNPLALNHPITITGDRDALLVFKQASNAAPWQGAILIGAGNVNLDGFSIRFGGEIRWALHGPGGAAIIRSVSNSSAPDPIVNVVLSNLDIEAPSVDPATDPRHPVEEPYLTRLAEAVSGRIIGNRFRGGTVDVSNGPWVIERNEHRGTPAGTIAWDAFGGHWLHDVRIDQNRVYADGAGGKIWRFISMNQLGQQVLIRSNDVSGVGMRDNDPMPNPNAPEILLTESYRLYFEGRPAAVSKDGAVLQIPTVMYGSVRPGSLVSILTGENAGKYFTIAQPLSPTAFLMADPLPAGDYAVSIAHGFVDCAIEGNRIDVRGGRSAVVVLAGNHWGMRLAGNHLLGGGDGMLVQSTPTENPNLWGWSHTPFMGFVGERNTIEGSLRGVSIDVYSDRHNKTTLGRTYLSGIFRENVVRGGSLAATNGQAFHFGAHSDPQGGQMRLLVSGNQIRPELQPGRR